MAGVQQPAGKGLLMDNRCSVIPFWVLGPQSCGGGECWRYTLAGTPQCPGGAGDIQRHHGQLNVVFVDGHAKTVRPAQLFACDGVNWNRMWNATLEPGFQ